MSETERLSSFVEMILDLSALEAGRFQLQIRDVPVEKVIRDVIFRFSNQPNSNRLVVNLPPSLPFVLADDQALQSILLHLIDNAFKYAPEGKIIVEAIDRDHDVLIQVKDSGPGIPEEERDRVFEMFYRLDTSDSRPVYGRGLGLNLAKRFLDLMQGGIQIKDAQGHGTIVEFWLPKTD
jgi:two-component system sensor histidine kinase KdpD